MSTPPIDKVGTAQALRQRAEDIARGEFDLSQTLHELRVHQIELEMQNEELRRSHLELDATRANFFDFYDRAPVGYCTVSASGLILQANLTAATLLGIVRSALVMRPFSHFILKADQDNYYRYKKQTLAAGETRACELQMTQANGTPFWAQLEAIAAEDDAGTPVLRIVLSNITERKRADDELRIAAVAFATQNGMMITDPQGVIQRVNPAFTRLTGYSAEEAIGQTMALMQSGRQDRLFYQTMWATLEDQGYWQGVIWNKRKNGQIYAEMLNITAISTPERGVTHYVGSFIDITEDKEAEAKIHSLNHELVRQQQQLEKLVTARTAEIATLNLALVAKAADAETANQTKSAFLAAMSHELRTPLSAVIGLTGLLVDSPLNRRQRDYTDKIQLSAQTLRTLIDNILDFSKIEVGELRLEQAPFSLNAILRTTATVIGVALCGKPIEALFDVASDVPDALMGDALRLQQILLNLTSNAVKFTETGDIVVTVRCLARTDDRAGDPVLLQLTVRDTGIGIPSDRLGPIFESFMQADTSTSRLYGGSGLGLTISARMAQLMGGQIEVDSTLGQGSEFRLEVPLALGINEPAHASPDIPNPLRILIIDDNPLARDILLQTCTAFGWQATALDSGSAGLAELRLSAAQDRDYDLLLLDWHMPTMDGLAMLRQAYAASDIGLPLVVLMAATFELEQAVAASDDIYLDGLLAKPMTPASLFEAVKQAYSGEFTARLPHLVQQDRRLAGMRLLVAEDNELIQEVIEQVLTRAGAEVVIAANGLLAVQALRVPGAHFDAVLMDIQMPVMDGYSATRLIREGLGLVDLPIIAVTAFARPEDREKSRLAGMVGHISKPLDVEDLLDLVARERQGVLERPIALAGLDIAATLAAFGGDRQKHGALLRKFIERHGGDADEAQRLFSNQDPQAALKLLHDLGGVAGILQASTLARLAGAAEAALLDGNTAAMPGLLHELQDAMQTVTALINQFEAANL